MPIIWRKFMTQLERARENEVTPEMKFIAERGKLARRRGM